MGRAEWFIIIRGWMLIFLQESIRQVSRMHIRINRHSTLKVWRAWKSSCWFPCWEICYFTIGRFSFLLAFSIRAITTAKTQWSHHHLSHPTTKSWLASPTVRNITLCLNACRSLQIKTKYSSWGLMWGFLFARFGWGVGWGLLPSVTFFHAVCTFVFPLRTRNKTRLFSVFSRRKAMSDQCTIHFSGIYCANNSLPVISVGTFQVWC